MINTLNRCAWVKNDPLEIAYHDQEWGIPLHDDQGLFEFLILEGAQAGLSWSTILKKRENYRLAFAQFDPVIVADYDVNKIEELMQNAGIVRNRRKIEATILNAQKFLEVQQQFGTFDYFLWQFVEGKPKQNHWQSLTQIPTKTSESDALSKALKKRGFKFVGSTICYALMQAVGMVSDHTTDCFCYRK
jgi:DNA-3-methyladenine glycosylase I